jgi:hypothetical protein
LRWVETRKPSIGVKKKAIDLCQTLIDRKTLDTDYDPNTYFIDTSYALLLVVTLSIAI